MLQNMITNWKTTSTGILGVLGGIGTLYFAWKGKTLTMEVISAAATAILAGLGLIFARDGNKTSEQSGASK